MRGSGRQNLLNLRPNALGILHDFSRRKANDFPAVAFHSRRAPSISLDLKVVVITVDLDHQLARDTCKIGEVGAYWVLAPKLDALYAAVP